MSSRGGGFRFRVWGTGFGLRLSSFLGGGLEARVETTGWQREVSHRIVDEHFADWGPPSLRTRTERGVVACGMAAAAV